MFTTLNAIRKYSPDESFWVKLLACLGKTKADDEPLSIIDIIKSNGLRAAIWCLRAVDGHDKEIRLFAIWCARQMQHFIKDKRSLDALDVAEAFANGDASKGELELAWNSARDAAWFAWSVASYTDRDATWDATLDVALAASAAVKAAAKAAARAAALAASAASWAAADATRDAVWEAASDAALDAQEKELIRICELSKRS